MQKCVVFAIPMVEKSTKKASDMETSVFTESKVRKFGWERFYFFAKMLLPIIIVSSNSMK
ncbi:hypothetical protein DDT91_14380 [Algoriphagus sp. AK58]|nr:hypothetical protein [Algoriphagus sp. AK58]